MRVCGQAREAGEGGVDPQEPQIQVVEGVGVGDAHALEKHVEQRPSTGCGRRRTVGRHLFMVVSSPERHVK
jgi:hypothetical protein